MQDTMHVQPLSFQDRYASYAESRPRKSSTYSSSFASTSATSSSSYASPEPAAGDYGVPLTRRKHHPQLHFFDEALGEEGADASVLEDEVCRPNKPEDVDWEGGDEDDEDKEPVMPRRRRYLTEAEYQREASDYTRQQLKQSGLYYKHAYHFWRLRSRDSADLLRQHLVKVLVALAVLIVPIMLGLYLANDGGSFGSKPDVSMLPDLAQNKFPSNAAAAEEQSHQGRSLFNRLMRRAGLAAKRENATAEALVPAPLAAKDAAKPVPSPAAQTQQQAKGDTVNHIGVYEEPGLGFSILPSMEGMNIFSFAYTAAIDFFSKTFGWESSNVTATAA